MNKRRPRPLQLHVLLRLVCGLYLIYLAWGLKDSAFVGSQGLLFGVGMIVFALVGVVLAAWNIKILVKGEYRLPHETEYLDQESNPQGE